VHVMLLATGKLLDIADRRLKPRHLFGSGFLVPRWIGNGSERRQSGADGARDGDCHEHQTRLVS
jgi:hypothetical protein